MLAYSLFAALIIAVLIITAMLVVSYRKKKSYLDWPVSTENESEEPGNPSESEHPEAENAGEGEELIPQEFLQSAKSKILKFVEKDKEENAVLIIIRNKAHTYQVMCGKRDTLLQAVLTSAKDPDDKELRFIIKGASVLLP